MDDRYRFGSTVVVWVAYAAILITLFLVLLFSGAQIDSVWIMGPLVFFLTFLTAVAAYATRAIWHGTGASRTSESLANGAGTGLGKAKRREAERLQHLIERLDEDEIVELESLLMSRGVEEPFAGRGQG